MSERDKKEAFVTLATNDTYSLGCLVLGSSLRRVKTTRQLVVMVTTGVSNPMRVQLAQVFDVIQEVNILDSNDPINLALLGRPDLNVTFTKLHCWRLTQFDKAVFLDADTLVLQNVDELFEREELSAAPDAGWPDCFNSGVFVFKPSLETYQSVLDYATSQGSFDGGDQGLLNMYFKNWATEDISKHLPFIYNVVSQAFYSYLPAFTQFKDRVKIVHFIGAVKPWHHTFDTSTRTVQPLPGTGHSQEFLQVWWNIFIDSVQPFLDPSLTLFAPWPPPATEQNKGDTRSVTGETVYAVFPYKPPDVGELFYEEENNDCTGTGCNEKAEKVIEMTVIPRSYSELESHYAEEPISHINPTNPPPGIYSAPWITAGWEKGTKGTDPNPPDFTMANKSDETESAALKSNSETVDKENSINENENLATPSLENNEEQNENSTIGLVGELASMTIQSPASPASPVPDAQRKLNWERGQIDYLGQDSFENIQKKIEETLNTTEAAPAPTVIVSPFAPKSTELKSGEAAPTPPTKAQPTATQPAKVTTTANQKVATTSTSIQPVVQPKVATKPVVQPKVATTTPIQPVVQPKVATKPLVQPKVAATSTPQPVVQPKVATKPLVQPKVATTSTPQPVVQPKVATKPLVQPKVAATSTPVQPVVQPKVALKPVVQPKVATPTSIRPLHPVAAPTPTSAIPKVTSTGKPGAAGVTPLRPPAPGKLSGSTQPVSKTSSLNFQASSKKK